MRKVIITAALITAVLFLSGCSIKNETLSVSDSIETTEADVETEETIDERVAEEKVEEDALEKAKSLVSNEKDVVENLRHGLREHSRKINIRFNGESGYNDALIEIAKNWVEKALMETDNPREGDYIRYQIGRYNISSSYSEGDSLYTVSIQPKYYMYHVQEEEASHKAVEVLEDLGIRPVFYETHALDEAKELDEFENSISIYDNSIDNKSNDDNSYYEDNTYEEIGDYEKIRRIYDYVCKNIKYDYHHDGMWNYTLRSTSYAGLVKQSATCQGYCVTLYRLLKEAGIDCRIITGQGRSNDTDTLHAWNIVALDGKYYYLDATWDSEEYSLFLEKEKNSEIGLGEGKDAEFRYRFFLRGKEDFHEHTLDSKFDTPEFLEKYPISDIGFEEDTETSYPTS